MRFNGSIKDTLYAEFYTIMKQGILFPCHLYLKSQTGNESYGTETLKEVKVCRGYVAFVKKYGLIAGIASNYPSAVPYWQPLLNKIRDEELERLELENIDLLTAYEDYVSDIQDEAYHQYKDDKLLDLDWIG